MYHQNKAYQMKNRDPLTNFNLRLLTHFMTWLGGLGDKRVSYFIKFNFQTKSINGIAYIIL